MKKTIPALFFLLAIAILGYVLWIPIEVHSVGAQEFTAFLPESTAMLIAFNSPLESMRQVNLQKHQELLDYLSIQSQQNIGFDVTRPEAYAEKGIDISKPCGFSFIDFKKMRGLFFIGVKDRLKFEQFLHEKIFVNRTITPKNIASVPCVCLEAPFASNIYCFKDGYCLVYGSIVQEVRKNLDRLFEQDILSSSKRLKDHSVYLKALGQLEATGDLYFYMDYPSVMSNFVEQAQNQLQGQPESIQNIGSLVEDFQCVSFSAKVEGQRLAISSYVLVKKGAEFLKAYQGKGSCADLLDSLPSDPVICLANVDNPEQSWKMAKQNLNSILPLLPMTQEYPNCDELMNALQEKLKNELGISLSFEKDIVQNLAGGMVCTLYDFAANPNQMDVDLIVALKIKDAASMDRLLQAIVQSVQAKYPEFPLADSGIKEVRAFTVDLKTIQPTAMVSPTIGIFKDYLIVTSKKDILEKVVLGEGKLLTQMSNEEIRQCFKDGNPSAGYIKLDRLIQQICNLLPPDFSKAAPTLTGFTDHFKELSWSTALRQEGIFGKIVLQADGPILEQIFNECQTIMKNK